MMTERIIETYQIEWRGIAIEIRYAPSWSPAYQEVYGEPLAHLEVAAVKPARAELPITETGYQSLFLPASAFEAEDGPVAFVQAWLEGEAESEAWKQREEASRQMSLF